jgi:hypothetical protein
MSLICPVDPGPPIAPKRLPPGPTPNDFVDDCCPAVSFPIAPPLGPAALVPIFDVSDCSTAKRKELQIVSLPSLESARVSGRKR